MVKKTNFNTKVTEIEGKIRHVSSLVTKSTLTVVENKIHDVSSLVKKTSRLVELEIKLIITIMTNTLPLQHLILWRQVFLKQD